MSVLNNSTFITLFGRKLMYFLRQSTAGQEVLVGPFLDTTTEAPDTGLTIANTDVKIFKAGATSEVNKNSGGGTHIAAGRYYIVLDDTDTNTVGSCEINIDMAGDTPVKAYFTVLPALIYDALIAGSDNLQTDVVQVEGADATTYLEGLDNPILAILGTPAGASVSADIAEINTRATDIQGRLPATLSSGRIRADTERIGNTDPGDFMDIVVDNSVIDNAKTPILAAIATVQADTDDLQTKIGTPTSTSLFVRVEDIDARTSVIATDIDSIQTVLGTPAGASMSADILSVQSDTNDIQTRLPSVLVGGKMDSNVAKVNNTTIIGTGQVNDRFRV